MPLIVCDTSFSMTRSFRITGLRFVCAAGLYTIALAAPVIAQDKMVIYRCTDPAGHVTLQNNTPCPKGHAQQIRDIGALPTTNGSSTPHPAATKPAPIPSPSTPSATKAAATHAAPKNNAPANAASTLPQPPPALYQCRTWDNRDYLGDIAEPPATCAPLQIVGIDDSPAHSAGTACEMRRDTCTAIAAEQLCATWKRRVNEAEFRWKFAGKNNDARKAEYDRFAKIYFDSACAR
jgi:hypothetical protein